MEIILILNTLAETPKTVPSIAPTHHQGVGGTFPPPVLFMYAMRLSVYCSAYRKL